MEVYLGLLSGYDQFAVSIQFVIERHVFFCITFVTLRKVTRILGQRQGWKLPGELVECGTFPFTALSVGWVTERHLACKKLVSVCYCC